ncbi:hypothetical protein B0H34DRAFT_188454 [Crassisporium funariophilum]|nr:hypothetical protein B0H34DRAFT_188454 [Crassisporium funariophilum]
MYRRVPLRGAKLPVSLITIVQPSRTPSRMSPPTTTSIPNHCIPQAILQNRNFHCSNAALTLPNSSQPANPLPELSLPEPVGRTPSAITKREAVAYLQPLYLRDWEVKYIESDDGFNKSVRNMSIDGLLSKIMWSFKGHITPFLVKTFRFKGNKSARTFMQNTFELENQENHHLSLRLWSERRPTVTVITQTHSARRHLPSPESTAVTEPGITLRDIRIAVLLENSLNDSRITLYNASDPGKKPDTAQRVSWETLLAECPWTSKPK